MKNNNASNGVNLFNELNSFVNNIVSESYHTDMVYYTVLFKLAESNNVKVFKEYENAFRVEGFAKYVIDFFRSIPEKEMPLIYNPMFCLRDSLLQLNRDEKFHDYPENSYHNDENITGVVADGRWEDFMKTPEIHERVIEISPKELATKIKSIIDANKMIDIVFEFNCEKRANLVYGDSKDTQEPENTKIINKKQNKKSKKK